ncbi:MAG: TonB-dependent receptor plug domain-containing protein [Myxococcota bacterium]
MGSLQRWFDALMTCCLLASLAPTVRAADGKPADTPTTKEDDLVSQVLDARGASELSLERLLDLPVVTASGKSEERSLASANVFIVTREQIERHGYRSLGEILRRVPGLYLTYDYVNYSVGVREVTGGYRGGTRIVKIMVDGFPVSFRPDLEAFLGSEFIPVEAIERVEVAKGPLSALYGANAFLATVNVITREPENREVEVAQRYTVVNGNSGVGTSAVASYGGIDTQLLLAVSTDRTDRSGAQSRPSYRYQELTSAALQEPSARDLSLPVSAFGRLDYHHDKLGDFRLEGSYQELDAKTEFYLNSLVTHRSRVNVRNQYGVLHWQRKLQSLTLRGYAGVSHGSPTHDYQLFLTRNPTSSYRPRFHYTALNAKLEASYDFGHLLQADLGGDIELANEGVLYYTQTFYDKDAQRSSFQQTDLITAGNARDYNYRQIGGYLQLHSAPIASLPDLRLTAAGRIDAIEFGPLSYPVEASFRGAVAYRFGPRLTARLIGGRAFQTPSGTLLFAHGGFGNQQNLQGTERLSNPFPLRPQVVTSAELVASTQISEFLSVEASVFYQDLNDAIRFNQAGQLIFAKNGGQVSTAGGELIVHAQFGRVHPYAAISASRQLAHELPRDLRGIASFSGSPSMYPRWFGYAGFDVELLRARLFVNAELFWSGQRGASQENYYQNASQPYSLPAYHTLDLTLSTGALPLLGRELGTRFLTSVRNVFAEDYLEPGFSGVDIPQPATSLLFQIRQTM